VRLSEYSILRAVMAAARLMKLRNGVVRRRGRIAEGRHAMLTGPQSCPGVWEEEKREKMCSSLVKHTGL
jgi:hypothetical protein